MGWDTVDVNRRKFKGKIRKQWGDFAAEHLDTIMGKRNQLARKLQQKLQQMNRLDKEELSAR